MAGMGLETDFSKLKNIGFRMLEAMALGTPVITTGIYGGS